MKNKQVIEVLLAHAELLEILDRPFEARAYGRAARVIEGVAEDIAKIYSDGRLLDLPGIGKGIGATIEEYLESGKSESLEELKKEVPVEYDKWSRVQDMGPKTIKKIWKGLGITTFAELKKAAKAQEIRTLKGLGPKIEENILHGGSFHKRGEERIAYADAKKVADDMIRELKKLKDVRKISVAGSLRRKKATIGDIDILVGALDSVVIMDRFIHMGEKILARGKTKSSIVFEGVQIDLRVVKLESWGSALQYFTGSKEHNVKMRGLAKKKGLKLSEYGIYRGEEHLPSSSEKDVYSALGLDVPKPESR